MIQQTIAAKGIDASDHPDLVTAGFTSGHAFKCHTCDVWYRLFYQSFGGPPSMTELAALTLSFESCVENSHPDHPGRIPVTRQS
jgi:hypothetical protein